MRRVFISILGTGHYGVCRYVMGNFKSSEVQFVQEATLEYLHAREWNKDDRVCILLTERAKECNWRDNGHIDRLTGTSIEQFGLEKQLSAMNLPCKVDTLDIPEGKNESEIWSIFTQIFEVLEEEDELFFDLTHGFRYLPMLILVLGNYAKFLKGIKVGGIMYGNYETRNKETNEAPFINLLPLSILQDWASAADNFKANGSVTKLKELSKGPLNEILKINHFDAEAQNVRGYVKYLTDTVADLQTCRSLSLINGETIRKMKDISADLCISSIPPMNPIFREIKRTFDDFNKEEGGNIMNGYAAAKWCLDNNLYQQALTILHENLISSLCLLNGLNWKNKNDRDLIGSAFRVITKKYSAEDLNRSVDERKLRRLLRNKILIDNAKNLSSIGELRNDLNHAGIRDNPFAANSVLKNIRKMVDKGMGIGRMLDEKIRQRRRILINLSNHPFDTWSEEQKKASLAYGECEDLLFPNVDASSSEEDVDKLCKEYMARIDEMEQNNEVTVHIMGEMSFVYKFISQLQQYGITCIASTTERLVTNLPGDKKEVQFKFIRFREY